MQTMKTTNLWMTGIVAGLALVAGACGSSGTMTGPATEATGASIQGTVLSGAGATGAGDVRAHSAVGAVRVSVMGTALATVTDDQGRFRLDDVRGSRAS